MQINANLPTIMIINQSHACVTRQIPSHIRPDAREREMPVRTAVPPTSSSAAARHTSLACMKECHLREGRQGGLKQAIILLSHSCSSNFVSGLFRVCHWSRDMFDLLLRRYLTVGVDATSDNKKRNTPICAEAPANDRVIE